MITLIQKHTSTLIDEIVKEVDNFASTLKLQIMQNDHQLISGVTKFLTNTKIYLHTGEKKQTGFRFSSVPMGVWWSNFSYKCLEQCSSWKANCSSSNLEDVLKMDVVKPEYLL